ncbi:MAG: response regulator [Thermoplasmatota archaeon]
MGDDPIPKYALHSGSGGSGASDRMKDGDDVDIEMSTVERDLKDSLDIIRGGGAEDRFGKISGPVDRDEEPDDIRIGNFDEDGIEGDLQFDPNINIFTHSGPADFASYRIAGDFNDILTMILGNIRAAKSKWFNGEDISSTLDHAEESVYRAKDMTGELISSTQPTTDDGGSDVACLLELIVPMIFDRTTSPYHVETEENIWRVECDPDDLCRTIINVLVNAKDIFSGEEVIFISASNRIINEGEINSQGNKRYVSISIHDREWSSDDHDPQYIRAPFFSREWKGRGLDFPAAREIVEKQGGRIFVDSQRDEGFGIQIYLPALDTARPVSSRRNQEGTDGGRVLIMEYGESLPKTTGYLLNRHGYDVVTVENGDEGVSRYLESIRNGKPFNLVYIDLVEFDRNDGLEMMRRIRKMDPGAVGILATGCNSGPILREYRKFGFSGHIVKPFAFDDLIKLIDRVSAVS